MSDHQEDSVPEWNGNGEDELICCTYFGIRYSVVSKWSSDDLSLKLRRYTAKCSLHYSTMGNEGGVKTIGWGISYLN